MDVGTRTNSGGDIKQGHKQQDGQDGHKAKG